jgi:hypothetical protein
VQRIRTLSWIAVLTALAVPADAGASIIVGGSTLLTQAYADQLETWLGEGQIAITRIFAKQSGDDSYDFHAAVDGKGRTFTVMQVLANTAYDYSTGQTNNPAQIIGGYNPQSWRSDSTYSYTPNDAERTAFLFNLSTPTPEIQRQSLSSQTGSNGMPQTYNRDVYGPTFGGGHDIYVSTNLTDGYAYNISYGGTVSSNNILSGTSPLHDGSLFGAIEVFTISAAPDVAGVPEPTQLVVWAGLSALGACGAVAQRQRRRA